ncbi:MAG: Hsp20/alpha crystallin family protein [Rhodospirillales bacterium]|nr:Hsp20/alpha crystallin family protein [Rhodospirillales bacterium]MCB9994913.1 Hsp20/alpha crystallin family protein [Rhodospirillales bacterium]
MTLVPLRKSHTPASYRSGLDDFDRMFDNFFKNALTNIAAPSPLAGSLALRMNVSETEKAYHIDAELPGIDEKDVELTVKDGVLTLSGETRAATEEDGKTFHRVERSYGSFKRSLQLPADANEDSVKAHMKNGILEIEVAKIREAKKEPKRIAIGRK